MPSRLPRFATMGVGSLPGTDPVEAVRHVMTAYGIPFCPQLPRVEGNMIEEWLGVPPGRCGWSPDRDRPLPQSWPIFLDAVVRTRPPHGVVKLQITGPVTLCWALEERPSSPPAIFARDVAAWPASNVQRQIAAFAERDVDCLLVADEPALGLVPSHPSLVRAWDPLRRIAGACGLHICSAPPWAGAPRGRRARSGELRPCAALSSWRGTRHSAAPAPRRDDDRLGNHSAQRCWRSRAGEPTS
jgi:hypothetical protein